MANNDFVVKNGLIVNTNLIWANTGKVGINNSTPDAALTVTGAANISGNVTIQSNTNIKGRFEVTNTAYIDTRLYVGNTESMVTLTNPIIQAIDNFNGFVQVSSQNLSQEDDACSDLLIYADNTNGLTYFNDVGLNNSRFDGRIHRISANTQADNLTLGETVFQSNGTANIAVGTLLNVTVINSTSRSVAVAVANGKSFVNTGGDNLSLRGQSSLVNTSILVAVPFGAVSNYSRRNYPFTIGIRTDGYLYQANAALTIGTTEGGVRSTYQQALTTGITFSSNSNTITCNTTSLLYPELIIEGNGIPANTRIVSVANSTSFKINKQTTAANSGAYTFTDPAYDAAGNPIIFHTNGMVAENEIARFSGNGNLTLGSNTVSRNSKLTVDGRANITGNATIGGTLTTTGAATLSNTIGVTGATTLSNTLAVTGAATFSNTLAVTGAANAQSTLRVGSTTSLIGAATLSNTIGVTGAATFSNTLAVTGAATLSNTLTVVSAANLSSTLGVVGAAILSNTLAVSGATTLSNTLSVTNTTTLSNTLNVTGAATLSNTLTVVGDANVQSTLRIGTTSNLVGAATLSNTLAVTGAATFSNTVTTPVSGITIGTATVNATNYTGTAANATLLNNQSAAFYTNATNISTGTLDQNRLPAIATTITQVGSLTSLTVTGAATLSNTIAVTGAAALSNTLTVVGAANAQSTLRVGSTTSLIGAATLSNTIAVTGAATFSNTVTVPASGITIGTATANATNYTGTAANATLLNNQPGSYYTNATNISTGTLDQNRLPAIATTITQVGALNSLDVTGNTTLPAISITTNTTSNVVTVAANLNVDTGLLFVDSVNNRVGINNSTPDAALTVTGSANVSGNMRIQGNLLVDGTTVSVGQSISQGDFIPASNNYNLGNTSNRWSLFGASIDTSGQVNVGVTTTNVQVNTIAVTFSNSTVTSTINASSYSGTAANATLLNNQPASFYANATNLTTGTVAPARLPQANATTNGAVLILDSVTNTAIAAYAAAPNSVKNAYDRAIDANTRAATAQSAATAAYSNAVSYADTKASQAYTNAITFSGNAAAAYANAIAYAAQNTYVVGTFAQNTYVNNTFAPKNNPSFTGLIAGVDLTLSGNLTVSGQVTYVNTAVLNISDNIITLNADVPALTSPTENAGIEVNRGSSANVQLRWNETSDVWQVTSDGTNFDNIISSANTANSTVAGIVTILDSVTNTSTTTAGTVGSIKNAYDRAIDANTRAASAQTAASQAYSNAIAWSGNAALAYANAIAYSSNATNLTNGTVPSARLPAGNSTAAGMLLIVDSVANISATVASSANSVKTAYDAAIDANTRATSAQSAAVAAYSNAIAWSGNAALAYANAVSFASNATNLTTGTVPSTRLPAGNSTTAGALLIVDSIANNSTTVAATANSVKIAYDAAISAYSNAIAWSGNAALAYANATNYVATGSYTRTGVSTHQANIIFAGSGLSVLNMNNSPIIANGNPGASGQVLTSNGSATYWANPTAASASNLSGGSTGAVVFQSSTGTTSYTTAGNNGQLLTSTGGGTPTWTSPSTLEVSRSTESGSTTYILGGGAGRIPYQVTTSVTGFTSSAGTSGQVLTSSGGSAPYWRTLGDLALLNTVAAAQISAGAVTSAKLAQNAVRNAYGTDASTQSGPNYVGMYVLGYIRTTGVDEINGIYSGSSIEPAGFYHTGTGMSDDGARDATTGSQFGMTKGGAAMSGTWYPMGRVNNDSTSTYNRITLFIRVS